MTFIPHVRPAAQALIAGCLLLLSCVVSPAQTPDNTGGAGGRNSQVNPNDIPDQITAVPNRPTFSTTAESIQSGVFEIEYGLEAAEGHQNINGLLKFGLTKNLELRFGNNPIERDAGVAGRGDSGAGLKYKIFEEKSWRPTFSVLYNATTPATMTVMGAATYNWSPRLIFDLGVYFAAYGNLPRATFFSGVTYSVADLYHHKEKKK